MGTARDTTQSDAHSVPPSVKGRRILPNKNRVGERSLRA
jgi:hypothetical protein